MDLKTIAQTTIKDATTHRKFDSAALIVSQEPIMTKQELSEAIAVAYHADSAKPELVAIKNFTRQGRKYGFPIICEIADQPKDKQLLWAARLLLNILDTWPLIDNPEEEEIDFELIPGSQLHTDAVHLVRNALANTQRVEDK